MCEFMKKPCKHCPFRKDVKPYLTPERGEELAFAATNEFNSFPCHKTTEHDEEDGETIYTGKEKQCAGFLTLMANENGSCGYEAEGFERSELVYSDAYEMAEVYENPDEYF